MKYPYGTTKIECVFKECPWGIIVPGPEVVYEGGKILVSRVPYTKVEVALHEHLESHSLLQWLQELLAARSELEIVTRDLHFERNPDAATEDRG